MFLLDRNQFTQFDVVKRLLGGEEFGYIVLVHLQRNQDLGQLYQIIWYHQKLHQVAIQMVLESITGEIKLIDFRSYTKIINSENSFFL